MVISGTTGANVTIVVPMSKVAMKVPESRKTGNADADFDLKMERDSFIEAINLLEAYPGFRDGAVRYLKNKIAAKQTLEAGGQDECFRSVSTLCKLDDGWVAAFIASHSKLTVAEVGRIKAADTDGPKQLMQYLLLSSGALKLPDKAIVKQIMNLACSARVKDVGNRLAEVKVDEKAIKSNGEINWGLVGPYKLVWQNGFAKSIVHRPTGDEAKIDDDIVVDAEFTLKDFHSDTAACLVKGPRRHRLVDFFVKPNGPWKNKQLTGKSDIFNLLVDQATAKHNTAQEELRKQELCVDAAAYKKPIDESKQAATKKARQALAVTAAQRAEKRRRTAKDCS